MISYYFFSLANFLSTFLILSFYFYNLFIFSYRSISAFKLITYDALENLSKVLIFKASDFCDKAIFASDRDTRSGTSGS